MQFTSLRNCAVLLCSGMLVWQCSGCGLLPQEAQLPVLNVVQEEEEPEYVFAEVTRGDVIHTEQMECSVVAREEESLEYSVTGERIEKVYVSEGDWVKAGDLVAELAAEEAEAELQAVSEELETTNHALEWAEKNLAICSGTDSLSAWTAEYTEQVEALEDRIAVLELRKTELEAVREAGRLYCSIDGVVTSARKSGSISVRGSAVATIVSRAESEYYTDTEFYDSLPDGMEVEIQIGEERYTAEVSGRDAVPEKTGRSSEDNSGKMRVYLTVTDNDAEEIDQAKKGTLTLCIDQREDVLFLPQDAVVWAGGEAMVYLAAGSLMEVHPVKVGLQADGKAEITEGLAEGDQVIIG